MLQGSHFYSELYTKPDLNPSNLGTDGSGFELMPLPTDDLGYNSETTAG